MPELDQESGVGVCRQGGPQGPGPQGEGRGQRPGLRPGVPAGKVLRHRRPRRHRRRAAGGQQHAVVELRPARRGEQGPVDGQGQGQAHPHRQGAGPLPLRRRQALGRTEELRAQVRPHPRALPAGLRPPADGRHLGAGGHPAPVRRGGEGEAKPVLDRGPEADPACDLRPRRVPGVPPPVHDRRVDRPAAPHHRHGAVALQPPAEAAIPGPADAAVRAQLQPRGARPTWDGQELRLPGACRPTPSC